MSKALIDKMLPVLIGLAAMHYVCAEDKAPKPWSIECVLVDESGEALQKEGKDVEIKIYRYEDNGSKLPRFVWIHREYRGKGVFLLKPNTPPYGSPFEQGADYTVAARCGSRCSEMVKFQLDRNGNPPNRIELKLAEPSKLYLRFKLIDIEYERPMKRKTVAIRGASTFDNGVFWEFGTTVSADDGTITFGPVPDGVYRPYPLPDFDISLRIFGLGPKGTPEDWSGLKPLPLEKLPVGNMIPQLFYLSSYRGLLWYKATLFSGKNRSVVKAPGRVLIFEGIRQGLLDRRFKDGEAPKFSVTVDKEGLIRTPVVDACEYRVWSEDGELMEFTTRISGATCSL